MPYQKPKPVNWTRESIIELGTRVAESLGYKPDSDLKAIIEALGGRIDFQNISQWLKDKAESIEVKGQRNFIIYLSDFTGLIKDRFTIAHELGHYVLHSKLGKVPIAVARHMSNDKVESEANWFAEGFLMPEISFRKQYKRNEDISSLASYFMVSPSAIESRARHLGIN